MALVLGIVAMWTSPDLVVPVSRGTHNVLIVIGEFLKMPQIDRMTSTCVVTQIAVPRMDLGVIPLTLTFDGNIATCQNVLQEVYRLRSCSVINIL